MQVQHSRFETGTYPLCLGAVDPIEHGSAVVTQFLGRQPILDTCGRTFGYELLYRSDTNNRALVSDPDLASATVINAALTTGIDLLCHGKRAFINCTEDLLLGEEIRVLPQESVVIEILESVPVTETILNACRELKQAGYMIALDDYTDDPGRMALLPFADIVKLESQQMSLEAIRAVRKQCGKHVRLLAEKVETWEQVHTTSQAGCELFQGYYFARPQMVKLRELSPSSSTYLRIMSLLAGDHFDVAAVVNAIRCEPSLCYRLLRYLNSYRFGLHGEIRSLTHALSLIGEQNFRRWLSIAMVAMAGVSACNELLSSTLLRARFCELLAPYFGARPEDLFLTGLLSLFHVILNVSSEQLLGELVVSPEVRLGLLGSSNHVGKCRKLVEAYCCGDWSTCSTLVRQCGMHETDLPRNYVNALAWAQDMA